MFGYDLLRAVCWLFLTVFFSVDLEPRKIDECRRSDSKWNLLEVCWASSIVCSRTASKRFSSPEASDEEEELEHDEYIKEDAWRGKDDHYEVDRWALDVTHSVASLSVSEMLLQAPRHTHKGGMDNFEKRLRSIITISS